MVTRLWGLIFALVFEEAGGGCNVLSVLASDGRE